MEISLILFEFVKNEFKWLLAVIVMNCEVEDSNAYFILGREMPKVHMYAQVNRI